MSQSLVFNPFTSNFDIIDQITLTPVGSSPNANAGTAAGNSLTLQPANTSFPGVLLAADWNTFNNKQNALTFGDLTDVGTDGITVTNGIGSVIGSGTSLSQHVADTTHNGYLSSTDWNTFNNKQPAGSYANINLSNLASTSINVSLFPASAGTLDIGSGVDPWQFGFFDAIKGSATSSFIDLANGQLRSNSAGALSVDYVSRTLVDSSAKVGLNYQSRSLIDTGGSSAVLTWGSGFARIPTQAANSAVIFDASSGLVASTTTSTEIGFVHGVTSSIQTQLNGKQASGNYITDLTGDATASGPGSAALTLATVNANVGSFGSASSVATLTANAKGLITAAGSTSIQIAESQVTNLVSDLAGKQPTGNYITALTGDVAASGPGSVSATIQANVVTNAKLAQMGAHTYKGNNTGSTANALDVTSTQLTADLNLFSSTLQGLVPASGGGTTTFLRADGSFAAPAGTVYTIGAIDSQVASANGAVITGSSLVMQSASATVPGLVNNTSQVFSGAKQFNNPINMNSNQINSVADPSLAQDAATKNYVDTSIAASVRYASVYAATAGANIVVTYNNGTAGVGATLTVTNLGAFALDGTTPPVNSRILIKDQSSSFQNGIYVLTVAGNGSVHAVLTRASDNDQPSEINGSGLVPVINGSINGTTSWQQVAAVTTVGTDAITYTQFTASPAASNASLNYFSGYMSSSSSWSTTSNTFNDGTNAGGNALTTVYSSGLTITAGASNVAGITFTPASSTSVYEITATCAGYNSNVNNAIQFRITDGTTVFGWNAILSPTAAGVTNICAPVGGVYAPGTTSPVTVKVQIRIAGGTANFANSALDASVPTVQWKVVQIKG